MSVRLLVLGLLRKSPLHGYEIKRIVETEMGDWADVAAGSIYFALDKLASDALIEEKEVSQEGGRPARTIYRITVSGQVEFERLLHESWDRVEKQSYPIDVAVAFMDCLPKDELGRLLQKRARTLEEILAGLAAHEGEILDAAEVPAQARFIFSHARRHYQAELDWTNELLAEER
jgi:DNA-binding PadR family transcriptional regulator